MKCVATFYVRTHLALNIPIYVPHGIGGGAGGGGTGAPCPLDFAILTLS